MEEPLKNIVNKSLPHSIIFILIAGTIFLGDISTKKLYFLRPAPEDSLSYDQGKLLLLSVSKDIRDDVVVSTQWKTEKLFDISSKAEKEEFPKSFYRLFTAHTTIQMVSYSFKYFKGFAVPESLAFAYIDTMSIQSLWKRREFVDLVRKIQATEASEILFSVKGWKDSIYSPTYDDPVNDTRALYKIHAQLIPGLNIIYCAPGNERTSAISYVAKFVTDSKITVDRTNRFHNSELEQSCNSCHEGLPSADAGKTMTADCNVCHKAMVGASYIHGPAEMKECASCHSWSAEKKSVVVEKGVPASCYDCHSEKQAQVENSKFTHPVASECLTCHSSHGTDQKHQLKENVYNLCTSCHEDQKINHPVGRHPLQFATLKNGDEISCVSCHNPHGSDNEKLKKFTGGKMDICNQCH